MKKFQTMMLMMLVAFMGMAVQSCGDDDDKVKVEVYYGFDLSEVKYISGYDSTAEAFIKDLNKALESFQGKEVTDELVIQRVQSVVDAYDNDVIFGTLVLKTGSTPNLDSMRTLKTFNMTVNPKYTNP